MKMYRVINGEFAGRIGFIKGTDLPGFKRFGNIMFYPIEGKNPYRVCLHFSDIEEVTNEEE